MLPDSLLSLYAINYSVSTIKEQTMLSILYNITIKGQKCVIITTLNLADKKVVAPLPPRKQQLTFFTFFFMLKEKLMDFLMPSQFSIST